MVETSAAEYVRLAFQPLEHGQVARDGVHIDSVHLIPQIVSEVLQSFLSLE